MECPTETIFRELNLPNLFRYTMYKDHITLGDNEVNDGMSLEIN